MEGGIDRERQTEEGESHHQHQIWTGNDEELHRDREHDRYRRQNCGPEMCRRDFPAQSVGAAADHRRRDRLNAPIGDGPGREEACDLHEVPAARVKEHRQADDEPDVARAEHEHSRRGKEIDAAGFREELPHRLRRFGLSELPRQQQEAGHEDNAEQGGHQPERVLKPTRSSRRPPTKNPTPFIAFLEPVNQATQRNS